MEPVYATVVVLAHALFKAEGLRFEISGVDNVPAEGGAVLVCNHLSYLDFAYTGFAIEPSGRRVRFMAKAEVFKHPLSGPLMRAMRHIPVDRASGAASFRAAVTALTAGEIVGVFPEATISRSLEPKEFKNGAVRMAAAAGVPILPMAIWGSQRVWTKGHPKRLGRTKIPISMSISRPITVTRRDDLQKVSAEVAAEITRLLQLQQLNYPAVPTAESAFVPARLGGTAPSPERAAELDAEEAVARAAKRAQ